jgi:hypothetical protein
MKQTSRPNNFCAKALLAGASLTALATHSPAQSADALIDKLVDKGILTVSEARDLRDEADKGFTTAFQSKMGMPDWVSGYKLSGDFRGRFENLTSENNAFADRTRLRYRVRVGLTVNMFDNLEAGLRLTSADAAKGYATGNALSGNSTFQDNGTKKMLYIDTAYGKWAPVNSAGWQAAITVGKMDNPFAFTPMVFDPDLTMEGAAVQISWAINDRHSLSLNGGAFVLDEETGVTRDPFVYGGQLMWSAKWTDKLSSTLGIGDFQIANADQLTTANVPYINQGNTRTVFTPLTPPGAATLYPLKYNYAPLIADASVTYLLDSFPFYNGAFPLKFTGEYINNIATSKRNDGFWVGATLGKSGTKKTWDITYRYEFLQADAWYDQFVDDDNGAFYPGNLPTSNSTYGYFAGTNVKGHMVKFNYSFTDSLTFSATCYINSLISMDGLVADQYVRDHRTSSALRFMADVMWKF